MLFVHVLQLFYLIIKILPNHIIRLFLLAAFQAFLPLNYRQLLPFQLALLLDEVEHVARPFLQHCREIIDAVLPDALLLGVILDVQHLAYDALFEHFDSLQIEPDFLQPTTVHLL